MYKINCPFHDDKTASLAVYSDHYYCYGCSKHGSLGDLGVPVSSASPRFLRTRGYPPEDINKSLKRILALPKKAIRGFELPYDDTGYYIVYPNANYYTKRLWEPPKPSDKYRGPAGHKKPLMVCSPHDPMSDSLMVVEGQLNAMTAALFTPNVVSPGAASDLNRPDFVNYYLQYINIRVIVDKDAAGVVSGIALRDTLLYKGKQVVLHAVETDFNDLYVAKGKEAVQSEISRAICVSSGVQERQESLPAPGEGTS